MFTLGDAPGAEAALYAGEARLAAGQVWRPVWSGSFEREMVQLKSVLLRLSNLASKASRSTQEGPNYKPVFLIRDQEPDMACSLRGFADVCCG